MSQLTDIKDTYSIQFNSNTLLTDGNLVGFQLIFPGDICVFYICLYVSTSPSLDKTLAPIVTCYNIVFNKEHMLLSTHNLCRFR